MPRTLLVVCLSVHMRSASSKSVRHILWKQFHQQGVLLSKCYSARIYLVRWESESIKWSLASLFFFIKKKWIKPLVIPNFFHEHLLSIFLKVCLHQPVCINSFIKISNKDLRIRFYKTPFCIWIPIKSLILFFQHSLSLSLENLTETTLVFYCCYSSYHNLVF